MIQKLHQRDPNTHRTGFESQFYMLSQVTPEPNDIYCSTAKSNEKMNSSEKYLPRENYCYFNLVCFVNS